MGTYILYLKAQEEVKIFWDFEFSNIFNYRKKIEKREILTQCSESSKNSSKVSYYCKFWIRKKKNLSFMYVSK